MNKNFIDYSKSEKAVILLIVIFMIVILVIGTIVGLVSLDILKFDYSNIESNNSSLISSNIDVSSDNSHTSTSSATNIVENQNTSTVNSNESYSESSLESTISSEQMVQTDISDTPTVTVAAPVAEGVFVVGGYCSINTDYILVSGNGVTSTKIIPYDGLDKKYFLGQVKYSKSCFISVYEKDVGKNISSKITRYIEYESGMPNYMFSNEYSPVIGKNSFMHFSSALVAYSLDTSKVQNDFMEQGKRRIKEIVDLANSVGAEPIFLIIPSSAAIYPETVPDGYSKTNGVSIFEAFNNIATSFGAKVIYPLETMSEHKNDGVGYQLYQHTDSHWSTYGSYWGLYDMFKYISNKFPNAEPRTLNQMGFYTKEMDGGDALFNYPVDGFEKASTDRKTRITKIKELTTLYSLKMPTNTLQEVYHNNTALYLNEANAYQYNFTNSNGSGLPTAVILRDSFSKVSFDMINDRFSKVWWNRFARYDLPTSLVTQNRPDYLIYLFSDRNLLKLLVGNSNASIMNLW